MASTQQPVDPSAGPDAHSSAPFPPPVLRLRLIPWDVSCAVATLVTLVVLAITTDWYRRLYGFLSDVCTGDDCPPVPYGVDFYIYPVVWGGLGAAISAALIGPAVSLLKGWYLSFWPLLAFGIVLFSSVAGSALTAFCVPYWHWQG